MQVSDLRRRRPLSDAWLKLGALEAQIGREKQRLALLESGLAATSEVTKFEGMEDLRHADERKAHVGRDANARASIAELTKDAKKTRSELEKLAKK